MNSEYVRKLQESATPIPTREGVVSVILPFYRSFDVDKALMSVESAKAQQGAKLEIVVAEENATPLLAGRLPKDIKYISRPPLNLMDQQYFRPGFVRNLAVSSSSGEFVYNNDGDILFQNPTFFRDLLEKMNKNPNLVLYQPPMRRLPVECLAEFKEMVEQDGLLSAMDSLDKSQDFAVTTPNNKVVMRVFRKFEYGEERIFLYTAPDHKRYISDPNNRGKEPLFSTLHFHAGGILMRRSQFDLVGGYSLGFGGWGCHDEDIQWKLSEVFDLKRIPGEARFEIIHLDHERDYFDKDRWAKNREERTKRVKKGVIACAIEDIQELNKLTQNGTR